ncbi:hypothetical protein NKJ26_28810 [Mesorhizobium sp. M0152]|uniref:hypothetical protein n=1 Tax=Mesorhizobium sp. M0152 TaxID=2956898 RepID=UPI003336A17C
MRVLDGRRRAPINGQDYHHPGRSFWPKRFSKKQEQGCNDAYQQKRRAGIHDDLAKPHTTLFDPDTRHIAGRWRALIRLTMKGQIIDSRHTQMGNRDEWFHTSDLCSGTRDFCRICGLVGARISWARHTSPPGTGPPFSFRSEGLWQAKLGM